MTRNVALAETKIQLYSQKDKEVADGPLTSDDIESVKSEGIEEYQKSLDYWEKFMISEFEVRT